MKKHVPSKTAGLIFILALSAASMVSQNKYTSLSKYGGGVETYQSCNGHGMFYSPFLSIYKRNSAYSFGPTIHKRSGIMNGFKVAYSCNLTGSKNRHMKDEYFYNYKYPDLFQLNFYSSLQYTGKLPLSYSAVKKEERINHEPQPDWSLLRIATAEASTGLSFQVNLTNNFCWKTYAGVSLYYHVNYLETMVHPKTGPAINLGTSVSFVIN
jgi:hypothetical protein